MSDPGDELRDAPDCPESALWVEYRAIPGIPDCRVGSDRSVWRNLTRPGRPPPWDAPRWRRLAATPVRDGRPAVTFRRDRRAWRRSVELLHRAAWASEPSLWASRIGPPWERPRPVRPAIPAGVPAPIAGAPAPDRPPVPPVAPPPARPPAPIIGDDDDDRPPVRVRGSRHGRSVLTEDLVIEARRLKAEGSTYPELVRRYGVGKVTLFYAITGNTWAHVPI